MSNQKLADKLKELRKLHGYTQDYVASFLGIVRQTYSHYETGKRTPGSEVLFKLSGLYNISVDTLLKLSFDLDEAVYYDAPPATQSSNELSDYIAYFSEPHNAKKYQFHSNLEKELLYYFEKLSREDKCEIIEFVKIKARKNNRHFN